jgi:hypothetical protein
MFVDIALVKATRNGPPIEFALSVTSVTLIVRPAVYLSTSKFGCPRIWMDPDNVART